MWWTLTIAQLLDGIFLSGLNGSQLILHSFLSFFIHNLWIVVWKKLLVELNTSKKKS